MPAELRVTAPAAASRSASQPGNFRGRARHAALLFALLMACLCLLVRDPAQAQARRASNVPAPSEPAVQSVLASALKNTQASAVVLRWNDGAQVASLGPQPPATPGSTIKPLLLAWALRHGIVQPQTSVYCRRALHIGARSLPCTHPPDQVTFTAQSALAESCNTYFAELGQRMRGDQLEAALRATHLPHRDATNDTSAQRQLTTLGLLGVTATPAQLAQAYRAMLLAEDSRSPVVRGLADSVQFGMANPARGNDPKGLDLLGKTGTASNPAEAWTHGWFAGALPGRLILVLYLPHASGGAAASLAARVFRAVTAGAG